MMWKNVAATLLLAASVHASAGTVTLADLFVAGATINKGDYTASNFQLITNSALNGATPVDLTQVLVTDTAEGVVLRLRFDLRDQMRVDGSDGEQTLVIQYQLTLANASVQRIDLKSEFSTDIFGDALIGGQGEVDKLSPMASTMWLLKPTSSPTVEIY